MNKLTFTLRKFTPAEAEAITGVTVGLQRDWRKRGFLAKHDGHARFTVFDLAEMWLLRQFSLHGIGPQQSAPQVEWATKFVVWFALELSGGFSGPDEVGGDTNRLTRKLWRALQMPLILPVRYLVRFADGSEWHDDSLDNAVSQNAEHRKYIGPVLVLDLQTLGDELADAIGEPIIRVATSDSDTDSVQ